MAEQAIAQLDCLHNAKSSTVNKETREMKNVMTVVFVLLVAWASGGCQKDNRSVTLDPIPPSYVPDSKTLTLSADQLVFLDWDGTGASRAKVVGKRVVGDSAVEFDIHFPSNRPGNQALDYVSGGPGGRGRLISLDIRPFEAFALRFTLVSIDGLTGSEAKQELAVGVLFGPTAAGTLSANSPVTLGGSSGHTNAVSSMPIEVDRTHQIGFHVHMVNPEQWRRSGSRVTIRVEPVDGATVCPLP